MPHRQGRHHRDRGGHEENDEEERRGSREAQEPDSEHDGGGGPGRRSSCEPRRTSSQLEQRPQRLVHAAIFLTVMPKRRTEAAPVRRAGTSSEARPNQARPQPTWRARLTERPRLRDHCMRDHYRAHGDVSQHPEGDGCRVAQPEPSPSSSRPASRASSTAASEEQPAAARVLAEPHVVVRHREQRGGEQRLARRQPAAQQTEGRDAPTPEEGGGQPEENRPFAEEGMTWASGEEDVLASRS
jgi:hypothetical protein